MIDPKPHRDLFLVSPTGGARHGTSSRGRIDARFEMVRQGLPPVTGMECRSSESDSLGTMRVVRHGGRA